MFAESRILRSWQSQPKNWSTSPTSLPAHSPTPRPLLSFHVARPSSPLPRLRNLSSKSGGRVTSPPLLSPSSATSPPLPPLPSPYARPSPTVRSSGGVRCSSGALDEYHQRRRDLRSTAGARYLRWPRPPLLRSGALHDLLCSSPMEQGASKLIFPPPTRRPSLPHQHDLELQSSGAGGCGPVLSLLRSTLVSPPSSDPAGRGAWWRWWY